MSSTFATLSLIGPDLGELESIRAEIALTKTLADEVVIVNAWVPHTILSLTFGQLTDDQKNTLMAFMAANPAYKYTYTDILARSFKGYIISHEITFTHLNDCLWSVSFEFEITEIL